MEKDHHTAVHGRTPIHPPHRRVPTKSDAPYLLGASDWSESIYRSLEVLVLGCPCALVLSAPLPMMTSLAASANLGHVLFKSVTALETLGKVRHSMSPGPAETELCICRVL
jgi:hypothetical protein